MRFAKFNRHNHRNYVLVHSNAILLVFSNEPNSDWGQGSRAEAWKYEWMELPNPQPRPLTPVQIWAGWTLALVSANTNTNNRKNILRQIRIYDRPQTWLD